MSDNSQGSNPSSPVSESSSSYLPESPKIDMNSAHISDGIAPAEALLQKMFKKDSQDGEYLPEEGGEAPANKQEDNLSKQFAALTRKDKQQREREAALKAERQQIAADRAEINRIKEIASKRDIKSLASELGIGVDDFVNAFLDDVEAVSSQPKTENIDPSLKALMDKIEQMENKEYEKEKQALKEQEDSIINGFKQEIHACIQAGGDDYELIQKYNYQDQVFTMIEDYYAQTKKILDVKEAADFVEEYLFDQASELLKLKKIQSKAGLQSQAAKSSDDQESGSNFTLTNTQASSRPTATGELSSREESLNHLSKLLKWG